MDFSIDIWKKQISWKDWKSRMDRSNVSSVYIFLSAVVLWPIAQMVQQGELAVLMTLGKLMDNVGSQFLADLLPKAADECALANTLSRKLLEQSSEFRKKWDILLEALAVFPQAREALPSKEQHWLDDALRNEWQKLANPEYSEKHLQRSGVSAMRYLAEAAGSRNVHIGRDSRENILATGDHNTIHYIINYYYGASLSRPALAKPEHLLESIPNYLKWMQDRYGSLELRGIKRQGQQVVQLMLSEVYVPLEVKEILGKRSIKSNKILTLGEQIVITGGPGCGKTTVLLYIAWALSKAISDNNPELSTQYLCRFKNDMLPLPIFVPLSRYAAYRRHLSADTSDPRKQTLAAYISWYLIEKQSCFNLPEDFFERLLTSGQAVILLLDGLDEVPNENERALVRSAVEELLYGRKNMRIVVTCRSAAYQGRTALGCNFQEIQVKPLDKEHLKALVHQAYQQLYRHDSQKCQQRIRELLNGIENLEKQRRKRLGKNTDLLINSPLLVRMLLLVHFSERRLPDQRSDLYLKATEALLLPEYAPDEAVANQIGTLVGQSKECHRELVRHLAFHMHDLGADQGREIDEVQLRRIFKEASFDERWIEALIQLTRLRGTLLEERLGMYRFLHLSFQDFLTARYLAEVKLGESGVVGLVNFLLEGRLEDSWWREPILLLAGYFSMTSLANTALFLKSLAKCNRNNGEPPAPDVQLQAMELALSALQEWRSANRRLRNDLKKRVLELFKDTEVMNGSRRPVLRVMLGRVLGNFGDPRPEVMTIKQMQFCYVPSGPFWMGSPKDAPFTNNDEFPLHCNEQLDKAYWISRYPITNAQFQAFIKSGGYQDAHYWPEAIQTGYWENGQIKGRWDAHLRKKPKQYNRIFMLMNYPVVGITWYEALAFARWLNEQALRAGWFSKGWEIDLPSEPEWEKAARGGLQIPDTPLIKPICQLSEQPTVCLVVNPAPWRYYPWGNDDNTNRMNYFRTRIGSTSAVGCFPGGVSVYGCEEMCGNVDEWNRNTMQNYPYQGDDERKPPSSSDARMVRGGTFLSDRKDVQCAARCYLSDSFNFLGFRIVIFPFSRKK